MALVVHIKLLKPQNKITIKLPLLKEVKNNALTMDAQEIWDYLK